MSTDRPPITAERLRDLLSYDPETGLFRWKVAANNRVRVGSVAGTFNSEGYRQIQIDGRRYLAHRLAWLYVHGHWPAEHVDHIDGYPDNNRLENLREATNAENMRNVGAYATNTSGFKGVSWDGTRQRWLAQIALHGRTIHLGRHDTPEQAHAAYCEASERLHGAFGKVA